MSAVLEMAAYQWESNNVAILGWKLETHVELLFKHPIVKASETTNKL